MIDKIKKPDYSTLFKVGDMCVFNNEYTATLDNGKKWTFYKGNEVSIYDVHVDRFCNCIDGYVISFGQAVIPVMYLNKVEDQ
jgi:hypothetical protein